MALIDREQEKLAEFILFERKIKKAIENEVKEMADRDMMELIHKIKTRYEQAVASVSVKLLQYVSFERNSNELVIKVDISKLEDTK